MIWSADVYPYASFLFSRNWPPNHPSYAVLCVILVVLYDKSLLLLIVRSDPHEYQAEACFQSHCQISQ